MSSNSAINFLTIIVSTNVEKMPTSDHVTNDITKLKAILLLTRIRRFNSVCNDITKLKAILLLTRIRRF